MIIGGCGRPPRAWDLPSLDGMKFDCKRLQRDIAEISYIAVTWRFAPAISKFTVALTLEREKPALAVGGQNPAKRGLSAGGNRIRTCMGLFLSSRIFGLLPVLCSERESRSSFRRLRWFAERAERGQGTETVAKLGGLPPSELVFRSALTPEHAER